MSVQIFIKAIDNNGAYLLQYGELPDAVQLVAWRKDKNTALFNTERVFKVRF